MTFREIYVYNRGTMNKTEIIRHFGSAAELARRIGVSRQVVGKWRDVVPYHRQHQIEEITNGAFKAMTHDEFIRAIK